MVPVGTPRSWSPCICTPVMVPVYMHPAHGPQYVHPAHGPQYVHPAHGPRYATPAHGRPRYATPAHGPQLLSPRSWTSVIVTPLMVPVNPGPLMVPDNPGPLMVFSSVLCSKRCWSFISFMLKTVIFPSQNCSKPR